MNRFYSGYSTRWIVIVALGSMMSCNAFWGDHPLGNDLSLLDGDKKEDGIIVYCGDHSGICYSGMPVIPLYTRQYDDKGHYAEYVDSVEFDKMWVIVRTVRVKEKYCNYWIINKDFDIKTSFTTDSCYNILQRHVTGPLNLTEFKNALKRRGIGLQF